jgi:hypothetical protein
MSTEAAPTPSITAVRIPTVKKGEYDLWAMKMRQYIAITNHALWDVIVNGNTQIEEPLEIPGQPTPPKPTIPATTKRNQDKALNILLPAIPDGHLLKFIDAQDAKQLWAAIKKKFGGNDASKKMHRNLLKQQFETFTVGEREGLDSAYERFQNLLSLLELYGAEASVEDANLKFLRRLPSTWHVVATMIRGQSSLDTMDFDDVTTHIFGSLFIIGILLFTFTIHFPKFDFCFMASSNKSLPWQDKCMTLIRSFSRKLLRKYTFRLKRHPKILRTTKLDRVNFPRIR